MMNVIDWIRETSKYMARTRPDIHTVESASADLIDRMEYLRAEHEYEPLSAVMSGGFVLLRMVEDEGQEEFQLTNFVSSVTTFQPEDDCLVLANPNLGLDLPGPFDSQDEDGLDSDYEGC
jgi:hypothetical protein